MAEIQIEIPKEEITAFCKRNHIRKFSLFGSVLRDDFRQESDIDVLVEFDPDAKISLFDWIHMEEDLASLLGRKVDLIEASSLRNPFRRYEILRTQQVIYDI